MKKSLMFVLFLGLVAVSYASNKIATDYYDAGNYDLAKSYFLSGNVDAMDSYYLGQIYFKTNKKDSAQYYFNKGLQMDPSNGYNKVGLAALSNDAKALDAIGKDKLYKKDLGIMLAIADAYLMNNNTEQVSNYVAKAKKIDKKNPLSYIFEGNQLMAQGQTNEAASKYENAIYFDPNVKSARVKLAQIYDRAKKPKVAMEYLNKAIEVDPQYVPGLFVLADIANDRGYYAESLEAFNKYLNIAKATPSDYAKYAQVLFFNNKYDQALNAIAKAPNTFVMNRLKMYSQNELKNYSEALATGANLFKMKTDNDSILARDYLTYASLLSKDKKFAESASYYVKAYNMDTTKIEVARDVAKAFNNAKDYPNAIKYYQVVAAKEKSDLSDVFMLGRTNYYAGVDETIMDKAQKTNYLTAADASFNNVITRMPDNYMGYYWRGLVNAAMDPEITNDVAKSMFEKSLELMLPQKDERKKEIIESYRYLTAYSFVKKDMAQVRVYLNKILEIDPANDYALQNLKALDAKPAVAPKKGK